MEEWKEYKLGDIADITKLAGFEFTKYVKYIKDGEIIAVRALNLRDGHLDLQDVQRISRDVSNGLLRSKLYKGDIVLSYTGTIGACAIITENDKYHLAPNVCKITPTVSIDPFFLYYIIRSKAFQNSLIGYAHGSTQPTIPMKTIREIPIRICNKNVQHKIASILFALDDKIECNRRINENLEQQAQALFKSWFVDFEPFKDQPFVDSELGMIPKGWKIVHLKDVCIKITDGVHNTVKDDVNGKYLLLSCKNIKGGKITIGNNERRINEDTFLKLRKRTMIDKGDILLSSVGTLGEMVLLSESLEKIEFQRSVAIVKPNQDIVSPHFLYYSLLNQKNRIINAGHGAVQQCLFISDIAEFTTIIPPKEFINLFTKVVLQLTNQITLNNKESRRLAELRDTLLPKLMSGEMKINDINLK